MSARRRLGHESASTTIIYLHADMKLNENVLERTKQIDAPCGRYQPKDALLVFLEDLRFKLQDFSAQDMDSPYTNGCNEDGPKWKTRENGLHLPKWLFRPNWDVQYPPASEEWTGILSEGVDAMSPS